MVKQLNFGDICVKLDICPGEDEPQSPMFNILQSVVMAEPAETDTCPFCETFLKDNDDALGKLKLNMERISKFTAQTCNKQGNKSMNSRVCNIIIFSQCRRHGVGWGGHVHSSPVLLELIF